MADDVTSATVPRAATNGACTTTRRKHLCDLGPLGDCWAGVLLRA
jgi:hypothetical protein